MTVAETRSAMQRYLSAPDDDVSMMSDDVVFRIMATGEEFRSPEAVAALFDYYYRVAFDATWEQHRVVIGRGSAVWEGTFVGTHIGEFAGVSATGRRVRIPLCVCYDFKDGMLVEGRVYFETPAFLSQVGWPADD